MKLLLKQLITSTGNGIRAAPHLWELNAWRSPPLRCAWKCMEEQLTHTMTCVCWHWQWLLTTSVTSHLVEKKTKTKHPYRHCCFSYSQMAWVLNQFDGCISLAETHTQTGDSSALTLPWNNATEVQFAFTFSQIARHFRHDVSAVIYTANGLSYDRLINKHWGPGEHPWILITSWPGQKKAKTGLTSIQCIFQPITVKRNKTPIRPKSLLRAQEMASEPLCLWEN